MRTDEQLLQMNERLERMETKLDDLTHKKEQPFWVNFGIAFLAVFVGGIVISTLVMLFIR